MQFRIRVNKAMGERPILIVMDASYVEARDLTIDGTTHFVYDGSSSVQAHASGQLIDLGNDSFHITR